MESTWGERSKPRRTRRTATEGPATNHGQTRGNRHGVRVGSPRTFHGVDRHHFLTAPLRYLRSPASAELPQSLAPLIYSPAPAPAYQTDSRQGGTQDEAAVVRPVVPGAVRRPAEPGGAAPAAAPDDPAGVLRRPLRVRHRALRNCAYTSLHHSHVTMHVIQTPRIRFLLSNGMRRVFGIS